MHNWKRIFTVFSLVAGLAMMTGCKNSKSKSDQKGSDKGSHESQDKNKDKKDDKNSDKSASNEDLPFEATGPVATVNGDKISADKFNQMVSKRFGNRRRNLPPQFVGRYKKKMLDSVINKKLVEDYISKHDLSVSDETFKEEFKDFKERFAKGKDFQKFLEQNQMSEDELKKNFRKDLALKEHLRGEYGIKITDKDAKKYYKDNKKKYKKKERVKASHILVKPEKKDDKKSDKKAKKRAQELAKKARKSDTDFAELAKKESDGPSSKKGGQLPPFSKKGDMVPAFSKAAFDLKTGDISDPVKSKFGYHVIKKQDHMEAETQSFDDVKGQIVDKLEQKEFRKVMRKFIKKRKKNADIQKHEDNIKVNVSKKKGGMGKGKNVRKLNPKKLKKKLKKQMKAKKKAQQKKEGNKEGGGDKGGK